MSFKNDDLKRGSRPGASGIVEITIHSSPRYQGDPVFPQTVALTNAIHTVRWRCVDLSKKAVLQIHFPADPHGPFVSFMEAHAWTDPAEVTGYGNRGPQDSLKEYAYEARIIPENGVPRVAGSGRLINQATKEIKDPRGGGLGEPPPEKDPPKAP